MTMQISDDQVRAIVAKSILESLTPEVRAQMLERAIVTIITPPKESSYGHYGQTKKSDLEQQFEAEARQQIQAIVRELVASDESIRTRIREVVTGALTKALASDTLETELTNGILRAFTVRE